MRPRGYANTALVLLAFGIVAAIGFLCGIATDQQYEVEPWLKRWETLTAGALAVAAAFVTVAAMLQQDEKQQERHEQLLNLALRGDAVKAQRASKFIDILTAITVEATNELAADLEKPVEVRERARNLKKALENLNQQIGRVIGARSLGDSYQIFDAETAYAFDMLYTASMQTVSDEMEWAREIENTTGGAEKLIQLSRAIRTRIESLGHHSRQLSEQLKHLASVYSSAT